SDDIARYEDRILQLLNRDRVKQGLEPLQRVIELDTVARTWSNRLIIDGWDLRPTPHNPQYSHQYPDGWELAGENIAHAYSGADGMYQAWYDSDGHRAAMLNPDFTHV